MPKRSVLDLRSLLCCTSIKLSHFVPHFVCTTHVSLDTYNTRYNICTYLHTYIHAYLDMYVYVYMCVWQVSALKPAPGGIKAYPWSGTVPGVSVGVGLGLGLAGPSLAALLPVWKPTDIYPPTKCASPNNHLLSADRARGRTMPCLF